MTLWTVACQAPLSMGFSRQEYWGGLPFPPPGDLPDPGIQSVSLRSPTLAGGFFTASTTWEALTECQLYSRHSSKSPKQHILDTCVQQNSVQNRQKALLL